MDSLINWSLSSDHTEIRQDIVQFYNKLYSEQFSWRPKSDGFSFNSIGVDESA
jgi:hypothetical protein